MATGNLELDPSFNLTERDRQVLALKDDDFTLLTWMELRDIIRKDEGSPLSRNDFLRWCRSQQLGNPQSEALRFISVYDMDEGHQRSIWQHYQLLV